MKARQFVTLKKDWSYEICGVVTTYKAGKRFKITDRHYLDGKGNFMLLHWYAYNQAEIIPAEFLKG